MSSENVNAAPVNTTSAEMGCTVDWAWLEGRKIAKIGNDLQNLVIEFEDGLTFKVQALNYKGQPFLSFTPYKDPAGA